VDPSHSFFVLDDDVDDLLLPPTLPSSLALRLEDPLLLLLGLSRPFDSGGLPVGLFFCLFPLPRLVFSFVRDFFSIDQVVGSGAFSQVSAVTTQDGRRFACKHLKQSLMDRPDEFELAAAEPTFSPVLIIPILSLTTSDVKDE
jgi:hypothetical protein